MTYPQVDWQLFPESGYARVVWTTYLILIFVVGMYLCAAFLRVAGVTGRKAARRLSGLLVALEVRNFVGATRLAKEIPEWGLEGGLRYLIGSSDLIDPSKINAELWKSEMTFQIRKSYLLSRLGALRFLFFLTLLSCVVLFFGSLQSISIGLATERVHGIEGLAEAISMLAGMIFEGIILLTFVILAREYCSLILSQRGADWDSFTLRLKRLNWMTQATVSDE